MDIKYLNVCLDKEWFTRDTIDKIIPKFEYKKREVRNHKFLRTTFYISVIMVMFELVLMFFMSKINISTILVLIFWILKTIMDWKALKQNADNVMCNQLCEMTAEASEFVLKKMKDEITFDELINSREFCDFNEVCHLIWIIYCTDVISVTYESGTVYVRYDWGGEEGVFPITEFYDKGLTEFNTVSVTKDGIFLGMNDDVLKHAVKSVVLKSE